MTVILGIGFDLVEVARLEAKLDDSAFLERVFTPEELDYCRARKKPAQHLAARWAAKEAVMKALGTGWAEGVAFGQIRVRSGEGPPGICLSGETLEKAVSLGVGKIHLSLTHTDGIAGATAVLESAEEPGLPIRLRLSNPGTEGGVR